MKRRVRYQVDPIGRGWPDPWRTLTVEGRGGADILEKATRELVRRHGPGNVRVSRNLQGA